ncbi:MAG TPA: phosphate ABC transporter permease subunit PstC [Solirubrobacteraceae bacterium]|nr:phosphate ABC transporter permease subunit PstC [Solirubrobacteraceae bacterium]
MSATSRTLRLPGAGARSGNPASLGEGLLVGLCGMAALIAVAVIFEVIYQVISGAHLAIGRFGLSFIVHQTWAPNFDHFGAAVLLYGTLVSSTIAMVLAVPIGVAIGLYLSLLAGPRIRTVVGPLVELVAAIPTVILGLWGILVLAPFVHSTLEPALHSALGFLPIFGPQETNGSGVFTAGLILTIMVVPIVAALSRDLFLTVPRELQDGAYALGATRWEVIRGVVLPSTAPGVIASSVLGLGRALGEAIAVTQVIGDGQQIHASLFGTADTFASRLTENFPGDSALYTSALFYVALLLLVIGMASNLIAQFIGRHFDTRRVRRP